MTDSPILTPVDATGWQLGLGNLLARENRKWWGSRRWLLQTGLWMLVLNGLLAFVLFGLPEMIQATGETMPDDPMQVGLTLFFGLGTMATAIGLIILVHGQIVQEKESGTAAWVLSKPVSRTAFVLAKLVADALGSILLMVLLQSLLAYGLLSLANGAPYPILGGFVWGVGLLVLHLLFYLALTYATSVFAESTNTVLAVSLGVLLGGALLRSFAGPVALASPWILGDLAGVVASGGSLPAAMWAAPAVTAFLTAVFVAAAIYGFARQEL